MIQIVDDCINFYKIQIKNFQALSHSPLQFNPKKTLESLQNQPIPKIPSYKSFIPFHFISKQIS